MDASDVERCAISVERTQQRFGRDEAHCGSYPAKFVDLADVIKANTVDVRLCSIRRRNAL